MAVWENSNCSGSPKAMIWWRAYNNCCQQPPFLNFYNNGGNGGIHNAIDASRPVHPDFESGELLWWTVKRPDTPVGPVASCRSGSVPSPGYAYLPIEGWNSCRSGAQCALPWGVWPYSYNGEGFLMPETVSTGLPRIAQPVTISTTPRIQPPRMCGEGVTETDRVVADGSPIYCTRIAVPIAPGDVVIPHGISGLREVVSLGGTFHNAADGAVFPIPFSQFFPRRNVAVRIDGSSLKVQVADHRGTWRGASGFVEVEFTLQR